MKISDFISNRQTQAFKKDWREYKQIAAAINEKLEREKQNQ